MVVVVIVVVVVVVVVVTATLVLVVTGRARYVLQEDLSSTVASILALGSIELPFNE